MGEECSIERGKRPGKAEEDSSGNSGRESTEEGGKARAVGSCQKIWRKMSFSKATQGTVSTGGHWSAVGLKTK